MSPWNDASELAGTSGCRAMPCAQELAAPPAIRHLHCPVSDLGPLDPSEGLVALLGASGTGKTHSAKALWAEIKRRGTWNPEWCAYTPSLIYWPDFVDRLRAGESYGTNDNLVAAQQARYRTHMAELRKSQANPRQEGIFGEEEFVYDAATDTSAARRASA